MFPIERPPVAIVARLVTVSLLVITDLLCRYELE
jgi:hypothetical protein